MLPMRRAGRIFKSNPTGLRRCFSAAKQSSATKNKKYRKEVVELRQTVKNLEEELQFFQNIVMESQKEDSICPVGHPIFKQKHPECTDFESEDLEITAAHLVQTAAEYDADGFAAPQAGIPMRMIIVDPDSENKSEQEEDDLAPEAEVKRNYIAIINPTWTALTDEQTSAIETCLSVPGICGSVKRYTKVQISGKKASGEPLNLIMSGWPARVFQHECDHLDGVSFIDRMEKGSVSTYDYALGHKDAVEGSAEAAQMSIHDAE